MTILLTQHRNGFENAFTKVTEWNEAQNNTGIEFSVFKQNMREVYEEVTSHETAWLFLSGKSRLTINRETVTFERHSIFEEAPSCLHVPSGTHLRFEALSDETEYLVFRVPNTQSFPTHVFLPDTIRNEQRGKGLVNDTCHRLVRTILDTKSTHPNCQLVLGEVVNAPGRWSSYPPHHHPHPEIYHYRFTQPQGYGHAEMGEDVFKVKSYDTLKIRGGADHAQCSAPGYGMYYAWAIAHLPDQKYIAPEFTAEHAWILDQK